VKQQALTGKPIIYFLWCSDFHDARTSNIVTNSINPQTSPIVSEYLVRFLRHLRCYPNPKFKDVVGAAWQDAKAAGRTQRQMPRPLRSMRSMRSMRPMPQHSPRVLNLEIRIVTARPRLWMGKWWPAKAQAGLQKTETRYDQIRLRNKNHIIVTSITSHIFACFWKTMKYVETMTSKLDC
jgi:hypothetical protein